MRMCGEVPTWIRLKTQLCALQRRLKALVSPLYPDADAPGQKINVLSKNPQGFNKKMSFKKRNKKRFRNESNNPVTAVVIPPVSLSFFQSWPTLSGGTAGLTDRPPESVTGDGMEAAASPAGGSLWDGEGVRVEVLDVDGAPRRDTIPTRFSPSHTF